MKKISEHYCGTNFLPQDNHSTRPSTFNRPPEEQGNGVEGDIIVPPSDDGPPTVSRGKRQTVTDVKKLWPNGIVLYTFDKRWRKLENDCFITLRPKSELFTHIFLTSCLHKKIICNYILRKIKELRLRFKTYLSSYFTANSKHASIAKSSIIKAMKHWEDTTCLKFLKRTSNTAQEVGHNSYITFFFGAK